MLSCFSSSSSLCYQCLHHFTCFTLLSVFSPNHNTNDTKKMIICVPHSPPHCASFLFLLSLTCFHVNVFFFLSTPSPQRALWVRYDVDRLRSVNQKWFLSQKNLVCQLKSLKINIFHWLKNWILCSLNYKSLYIHIIKLMTCVTSCIKRFKS